MKLNMILGTLNEGLGRCLDAGASETEIERASRWLSALVDRDADVRTLDDWAATQPRRTPVPSPHQTELGDWFLWLSTGRYFEGATPDEARAKAAAWVRGQVKP